MVSPGADSRTIPINRSIRPLARFHPHPVRFLRFVIENTVSNNPLKINPHANNIARVNNEFRGFAIKSMPKAIASSPINTDSHQFFAILQFESFNSFISLIFIVTVKVTKY